MKAKNDSSYVAPNVNSTRESLIETIMLNSWKYDRIIFIKDEITSDTEFLVNHMMDDLVKMDNLENLKMEERKPISIYLSSEGGSVNSALSIISKIESLKEEGYVINTYALGLCASAALQIFIFGSMRYCQKHTQFLLHQPSGLDLGYKTTEDARRYANQLSDLWLRLREQFKSQTSITDDFLDNISSCNEDFYFWPEMAFDLGIVDEII